MENIKVEVKSLEGNVLHVKHEEMETKRIYEGNRRNYHIKSLDSVMEVVKSKGNKEKSIIFYDNEGVQVIFDDTVQENKLDICKYEFMKSREAKEWLKFCECKIGQKEFINFIKKADVDIVTPHVDFLLANLRNVRIDKNINAEFVEAENGDKIVAYKEKNKNITATIPNEIKIHLPIIDGSEYCAAAEFEIEILEPRNEDDKLGFKLSCPKWDKYYNEAIEFERDRLIEGLEGYLVLRGRM